MTNQQEEREVNTTKRWGVGIIITIVIQSATIIWWASSLTAQVDANSVEISELKNSANVIISREQLDDILLVRDTRLDSMEKTLGRVEQKIDNLIR